MIKKVGKEEGYSFQHIMLAFSRVHAYKQLEAYKKGAHHLYGYSDNSLSLTFQKHFNEEIKYLPLYCWGYFDLVELFIFEKQKHFVTLQKLTPYTNTYEHRYHCGTILHPADFTIEEVARKLPLCGISFIKFKNEIFEAMSEEGYFLFFKELIKTKFLQYLESEEIKKLGEAKCIIIWSFGCEDLILLLFSDSYEVIKQVVFKLRTLEIGDRNLRRLFVPDTEKIIGAHVHACTFSQTVLSFYLDRAIIETKGETEALKNLQKKIRKEDIIRVDSIKLRTNPGHVDYVLENMQTRGKFITGVSAGRNDVHIRVLNDVNFFEFLEFYRKNILPLFGSSNSPVVDAETTFWGPEQRHIKTNEPMRIWESIRPVRKKTREGIQLKDVLTNEERVFIQKLGEVSENMQNSVLHLLTNLSHLARNPLTRTTTRTLCENVGNILRIDSPINQFEKEEFPIAVDVTMRFLSLCLRDRFRGFFPVGETGYSSGFIYKGNFQKLLISLDKIARSLYINLLGYAFKSQPGKKHFVPLPISVFIANESRTFAKRIVKLKPAFWGLIGIQLQQIFGYVLYTKKTQERYVHISLLYPFVHEVSHHVIFTIFPDIKKGVDEILAEFISFCVCADGDIQKWFDIFKELNLHFFSYLGRKKIEQKISSYKIIIDWLLNYLLSARSSSYIRCPSKDLRGFLGELYKHKKLNSNFIKPFKAIYAYRKEIRNLEEIQDFFENLLTYKDDFSTLFWMKSFKRGLEGQIRKESSFF